MFPGANVVYKLMYLVGFSIMMVINIKTHKRYRLSTKKTVVLTLITYIAGVVGAMIMSNIYSKTMSLLGCSVSASVAIFGAVIFTPLFMTVASLIVKQDWRRVLDMLAPGIFIILACAKFGCFLNGCCHGIECSFGVMNPYINAVVFPIQIVEVFFMCLIIAFCFWYAFKSKRYIKGAVYPVTTILYCFMRFFAEYLRYYEYPIQRDVLFGMTFWQLCCVGVTIISVIWIFILNTNKIKALDEATLQKEDEEDKEARRQKRLSKQKKAHKK